MQKYNLCYVLCKSCTKVLCIENANWWYLYAENEEFYVLFAENYVLSDMQNDHQLLCAM